MSIASSPATSTCYASRHGRDPYTREKHVTGKRIAFAGFTLAVVVALVGLYLATKSSPAQKSRAPERPTRSAPAETSVAAGAATVEPRRVDPGADVEDGEAKPTQRTYVDDSGRMVRDHRKGNPAPIVDSQTEPRVIQGKIATATIMEVRKALRPLVESCAKEIDAATLGADPVLQSEVLVTIADERLTISEVKVRLRDADDDELIACVREAAAAIDIPATGHDDVEDYWLTHPFRLRR